MPAYRDEKHGTFYASFYYTDFTGARRKKMKRGFKLKRDAQEWERQFLLQRNADPDMKFGDFVEIYRSDKRERIREHTWESKDNMINTKILPYFKDRTLSEIEPRDVIAWQNTLMSIRQKNGKPYSPTYLKSIHSQLSAIFNYAVKYYRLKQNPAEIAGNMGKETHREMLFWTKEEYLKFADAVMDKPMSYYAFEMLYWCGIRMGELLALTAEDFDFERYTLTINKSYQRLKGQDVITEPKTSKSNRIIRIPRFLAEEMQDYLKSLYGLRPTDRIFPITKSYLHREMSRGSKDHAIHITTAAHLDSAMCQQVYLSLDVFSNRNIKCAASEIIDQENTFRMCAAHDTHHRSNGLLHERHLADTRHSGGLHSGILLHLIERGRHCNHSCCFRIVPDFLREISI